MAPKYKRVVTYNLQHAKEVFEQSLELDEFDLDDEANWSRTRGPSENAQRLRQRNQRSQAAPSFIVDTRQDHHATPAKEYTQQQAVDLAALDEMFGAMHDSSVIQDVYNTVERDMDAALQILSDMTTQLEIAQPNLEAQSHAQESGMQSSEPAANSLFMAAAPPGVCWWDMLHESEKDAILNCLSARDMARVAWTCRDFAARVRTSRNNARSLVIPTGVTLTGVIGMVAGHTNARAISLVRWGAAHLRDSEFASLITAISQASHARYANYDVIEIHDRPVMAVTRTLQPCQQETLGSCNVRRAVRVEAMSLRGWTSATDSQVMTLLDTMQHLRELDLSDCSSITDAALGPISRYQRVTADQAVTRLFSEPQAAPVTNDRNGSSPAPTLPRSLPRPRTPNHAPLPVLPSSLQHGAGSGTENPWHNRSSGGGMSISMAAAGSSTVACSFPPLSHPSILDTPDKTVAGLPGPPVTAPFSATQQEPSQRDAAGSATENAVGMSRRRSSGLMLSDVIAAAARNSGSVRHGSPSPSMIPVGRQGSNTRPGGSHHSAVGGSSDDDESDVNLGGFEAAFEDEDDEVLLDEDIAAREQAAAEKAAREATRTSMSTATAGPSTMQTPPPPPPGSSHRTMRRTTAESSTSYGTPPLGSSMTRHGNSYILGTSPSMPSPLYGSSPPVGISHSNSPSNGSLTKGGSMASLGKNIFSKFSGGGGGGVKLNPQHSTHTSTHTPPSGTSSSAPGRGFEVLCLAGCSKISSDGVKALLSAPLMKQCLVALDVSRCMRMTRAALVLPPTSGLRVFKAAGCQNLHEVVMQLPLNSPLQELWLNNCRHLSKINIVSPRLTLLHVGGCKSLNNINLRCPRLTQLYANLCLNLTDVEAEDISTPLLEELNLFGCRQLSNLGLSALISGCAPHLQLLNLNGCNGITDLAFTEHVELRSLDVSGCKWLTHISCTSQHLVTLSARACHRLTAVSLDSPRLHSLDVSNCGLLSTITLPALGPALQALQAEHELQDVMSWRPRTHPAQPAVIASAARTAQGLLAGLSVLPSHVKTTGCDMLPQMTLLACKVLKTISALLKIATTVQPTN